MVKRIGGTRRKTRNIFSKDHRHKGKISLTAFFRKFENGERVLLKAEPAYHKGMYYRRFHGKSGIIKEKQGKCYVVAIKDKFKAKTVIVHPVHLRKL